MNKRIIAINLPQFHPFPENDEWWGKGFTEWTNVAKARPRFPGHYQPHLPTETGFYDLRLPEARKLQADMARESGIYGFCYYHYWFNGHQLMERPINDIIKSGQPEYPFMVCWANENWTRTWDGSHKDVLISQIYSEEDDINHIIWLCENLFSDSRYIRVNEKPVFAIYKPFLFTDMRKSIQTWRRIAKEKYNMELYIIGVSHDYKIASEYSEIGFDSAMDFQPVSLNSYRNKSLSFWLYSLSMFIANKIHIGVYLPLLISYKKYVEYKIKEPKVNYKIFPCVSPGWDNSPRRVGKSFTLFYGSTPVLFKKWLYNVCDKFKPYSKEENFIFINAWNEWAEGNHLEPDRKWGRQYLDAVKDVCLSFAKGE